MIGSLRGEIIHKEESSAIIDVGGVGYVVQGPTTLLDDLDVGRGFAHAARSSRAMASSTPFTKAGDVSLPKRRASPKDRAR